MSQNKDNLQVKIDKNKGKKKGIKIAICIILLIIAIMVILNILIKTNEDIEAKIIGSVSGVDWSEPIEVSTESLEKFEEKMKENINKYDKNVIIIHEYNGCGSCFEEILNTVNEKNNKYKKENLNIMLVTSMHEDDIKTIYKDKIKDLDIFSDFDHLIGEKFKVFNEIEMENEDVVIYIEGNNKNTEEYYFEESNEIFEYIDSKLNK